MRYHGHSHCQACKRAGVLLEAVQGDTKIVWICVDVPNCMDFVRKEGWNQRRSAIMTNWKP